MLKLYIGSVDFSDWLDDGSLSIVNQIQQKADTARFSLLPGADKPVENQELKIYDAIEIVSNTGPDLVLKDALRSGLSVFDFGKLRAGARIWLDVGGPNQERVTVQAIEAGAPGEINVTLTANPVNAHVAGELAGKLIFGGTLQRITSSNPHQLTDLNYECEAVDFTKIFDRKNINDSWQSFDARQIINDFLDTTVNFNVEADAMDYADNTAIQAAWTENGATDAGNPTIDTTDKIQGSAAGVFPWTFSTGSALWTGAIPSMDISEFLGVASGQPTKGNLSFWYRLTAPVDAIVVGIGNDISNLGLVQLTPSFDTEWHFFSMALKTFPVSGAPDWTAVDFLAISIAESGSGSIIIDDIRVTADGSFTAYGLEGTDEFEDARAAFKKPTVFVQELADALGMAWDIDYERDVKFFQRSSNPAPFSIGDGTDNFDKLSVEADVSQLKNRQDVRGGTRRTDATYSQVVAGNNAVREWLLKTSFAELVVHLDDNTSTDTMEATTSTTTVKATAHGLVTGDYIVNRTRSNAVRQIVVVDPDTFTVEAVASQASGDTFSKFATLKTDGVENLDDEASFDYMSSFAEKSVRASEQTPTLKTGEFLLFTYVEIVPVRAQVTDFVSVDAMKALVGGDGIFDGQVIVDTTLDSIQAARDRAQAEVDQYSNPIVRVSFRTDHEGLVAGQLVFVGDATRGVSGDFLIQRVKAVYRTGDLPTFEVQCASTLFGIIEYFQKIARALGDRRVSDDEAIEQFIANAETITFTEEVEVSTSHNPESETITLNEDAILQPLDYAIEFVVGPHTPTVSLNGADKKRVFLVDGSELG